MTFSSFADEFLKIAEEKGALGQYATHSALNLGQAARDLRWIHDHPDADGVASSVAKRVPSLASNLLYTILPPQLHHTKEELKEIEGTVKENFLNGYAPWKYKIPKSKEC